MALHGDAGMLATFGKPACIIFDCPQDIVAVLAKAQTKPL